MATVWLLHSINFGNAKLLPWLRYIRMILYQQLKYPYHMIWYHTIYQHGMISAWWDVMPGWCIIVMRVYDIKTIYISIIWCIRAIWYISMTWHDMTAVLYNIPSQAWVAGIMTFRCFDPSVCWSFGAPVFSVSAFGVFTRQCSHIKEIIATNDFKQQKE